MRLIPLHLTLLALSVAAAHGQQSPDVGPPAQSIHLGATSGARVLFGRDTLTIPDPGLSAIDVYIDTAVEGRVGVVLPEGVALGAFPGVSYTLTQGDDGVSNDSLTLLAGVYAAYYLPVDWEIVPYLRLDNALRWNRTNATTPAAGVVESVNVGYLVNLDVGGAWFLTPTTAISTAVRGSLLSRSFTGAARVNLELAIVAGIDLFLPR